MGLLVMEGLESRHGFDQADGLTASDSRLVISALGKLHRQLRPIAQREELPSFLAGLNWHRMLADYREALPQFLEEFSPSISIQVKISLQRLSGGMRDIQTHAMELRSSATICSMDMRADNVMMTSAGLIFIDWQLAARAPGGFDLASLLSTSVDASLNHARDLAATYSLATKFGFDEVWAGFVLGLWVRAAFAVPVVMRLPHVTTRSRVLRRRAINRLSRLLNELEAGELDY